MMSSVREDVMKQVLEKFTGVLQFKLPLEHFSQFYEDTNFNNLAQEEAKQALASFHAAAASKLNMVETLLAVNEFFPQLQEVIEQWKVMNEENKTQCKRFLQSQVDFLLSDFKTSVMMKLISTPCVELKELERFLDDRKTVLIGIFEKLSKPGELQCRANMKALLEETLNSQRMETLEKQRLHLEQMESGKAKEVLEHVKGIILESTRRLNSELHAYQGNDSKEVVRAKLVEINNYLSMEGKVLDQYHSNIYSAILKTTVEVRKCLDEKEYKEMSSEEFAETLYEQLLFDFAGGEYQAGGNNGIASDMDLDSISSSDDESACENSGNEEQVDGSTSRERNEICTNGSETQLSQQDELQVVGEMDSGNSNAESTSFRSGEDEKSLLNEVENEMEESSMFCEDNLQNGLEDECSERSSNDSEDAINDHSDEKGKDIPSPKRPQAGSSKPRKSLLRQSGKHHLNTSKGKPSADKITYLHLNRGRRLYRCNVCQRKIYHYMFTFHGEHCGTTDDPLACKECGKVCRDRAHLKTHLRVHTGEKPFKCSKCSERFTEKGNLNKHFLLHSRGARFHCEACKLSFISSHRLHDHNKEMHKDKLPFGCRYCDQRFSTMSNLKRHVITHAGSRPFKCPTCNSSASSQYLLAGHIEIVHSKSKQAARKLANEAAVAYLVEETKDESYRYMPDSQINSLVVSHVIEKSNLKLPKRTTVTQKSIDHS